MDGWMDGWMGTTGTGCFSALKENLYVLSLVIMPLNLANVCRSSIFGKEKIISMLHFSLSFPNRTIPRIQGRPLGIRALLKLRRLDGLVS